MKRIYKAAITAFLILLPAYAVAGAPAGRWSGTVDQPGYGSYPTEMELNGEAGGTIDYPSLGCGGILAFTDEQDGIFYYLETINYGVDKCIDGGTVSVRPEGDSVYWEWFDGNTRVSGTLSGKRKGRACSDCDLDFESDYAACREKLMVKEKLGCIEDAFRRWQDCKRACR